MGRTRKRLNEKARQSNSQDVCRNNEEMVAVDLNIQEEKYDAHNPLVISGKRKKKTSSAKPDVVEKKPLSKKQKKKLANILAKKKKKINRAELLEKLAKVQAKPQELDHLTSTASMQTHGFKRLTQERTELSKKHMFKGWRRPDPPKKKMKYDPNIVTFESSDESDETSASEDEHSVNNSSTKDSLNKIDSVSCIEDTDSVQPIEKTDSIEIAASVKDIPSSVESETNSNLNSGSSNLSPQKNLSQMEREPAKFVPVSRKREIQTAREALSIFCEEQSIIEAIRENSVVLIHGETGSGKTTQVPQFLYEAGYALNNKMIGITEPRRIAAMTMAARVGTEMDLPDVVAYHVRYENSVKEGTQIKFMTDGVLLKEIRHDFLLSKYSIIIIDEAHERSIFSDILIGLLSRIVPLREKKKNPLKLVIMSATIRVEDFTENPKLFKEPPFLIRLTSRQYKVQVHFNKQTHADYLDAAYHKVCKIHSQLPSGAILVFLTGEKEVTRLCKMLRNTFPFKDNQNYESEKTKIEDKGASINYSKKRKRGKESNDDSFCSLPKINLDNYSVEPLDTDIQQEASEDEEDISTSFSTKVYCGMPLYTLPLYSILPFQEQKKVFQPPPTGSRLCVIATNVAETSITIPGLKYVVDSGKVKTKVYDKLGGVSKFTITWTSKASSNQRAGRAGRTEGGHCYRDVSEGTHVKFLQQRIFLVEGLYSSSVFEHELPDFTPPEITRIPIDDVLLQMKALGIDRVVHFPFPTPPDNEALKSAEQRLVLLGALQDLTVGERYKDIKKWEYSAKITRLGKAMSRFPLSPRYSKMLILSYEHKCIPYIIAIVAAMTVPEVFLKNASNDENEVPEEKKGIKKIDAGTGKSLLLGDAMVLLRAVALYAESKNKVRFCTKNGIRHKAMVEIHKMFAQLAKEMNKAFINLSLPLEFNVEPPNEEQKEKLRRILTIGFTDHVARILPKEDWKLNKDLKNGYKCLDIEEPVFIHPSSVLFSKLPQYVVYQEISHTSKYYMKGIVEINPEWLPAFAPTLCQFSEPLEDPTPIYDSEKDQVVCTMHNTKFGRWQWELPRVRMEMPKGLLKYSYFAFFLLDGQVHDFFKLYRQNLVTSPSTVLKSWSKLLPRTRFLLEALIQKEVDSKKALMKVWDKEPKYLLSEYWLWLPAEKHFEIECCWPPKR